jgi:dCTP deaminase
MLLTGLEIQKQLEIGTIVIDPFIPAHLSTNSYDVTLANYLIRYDLSQRGYLDVRSENATCQVSIPEDGLVLEPHHLYLGSTVETATSTGYVPMYEGKSSIGRLGLFSHVTAGFGDVGWGFVQDEDTQALRCTYPTWTLEMVVVHPVKIYPGMKIGQVYFFKPSGEIELYKGRYHHQKKPVPSRIWQDFIGDKEK